MRKLFNRLALVLFFGGFITALILSATATSSDRVDDCGLWWDGVESREDVQDLLDDAEDVQTLSPDLYGQALALANANEECRDAQRDRRTLTMWVGLATVLVPVALVFVGRAAD